MKIQRFILLILVLSSIISAQFNVPTTTNSNGGSCSCTCTCTNSSDTGNNNNNSTNTNNNNNNNNSTNSNNNNNSTNSNNNNNGTSTNTTTGSSSFKKIAYVNTMSSWYGPSIITNSFGLNSCYDIIILSFWLTSGSVDAAQLYENIYTNLGTDQYGKSNLEVQKNIADLFHQKGKQLFVSAFGSTDMPTSKDPIVVANSLADWVQKNPHIDGIDIDYEDNDAVVNGSGITWLIAFQKQLRARIGNSYIITHAPQAPYFSRSYYNDGGYYKLDQQVGNLINWYNVQFYNQGNNSYDSLEKLFVQSGTPFVGTSYSEIIQNNGVPISKLVLGKPATTADLSNTGYTEPSKLGSLVQQAQKTLGLQVPGFFIWQLKNDGNCNFANNFMSGFNGSDSSNSNNNNNSTNTNNNSNTNSTNSNNTNSTNSNNTNSTNSNNTNTTPGNTTTNGNILSIAYMNSISSWWGPSVLSQFNTCYDILILSFWLSTGPVDTALLYQNIYSYLGTDQFGKNNLEVQKYLQNQLSSQGKKLFISAFGATDMPTSKDPSQVATDLANFANQLPYIDGIDIDYEDNDAIVSGSGVTWLITFTKVLRQKLTNKNLILTHAPQAPYFSRQYYTSGAYYKIDQEVGNLIDWYNVQFYNQGDNTYDTYQKLFIQSGQYFFGTSYQEIVQLDGIPLSKLMLGKPATVSDATNTGYIDPKQLGQLAKQAKNQLNFTIPGFFIWQVSNDKACNYKNQFFAGYNS